MQKPSERILSSDTGRTDLETIRGLEHLAMLFALCVGVSF